MNTSPWIAQLQRVRPVDTLKENVNADVVIVGGGIAGVATAYFTLRDTQQSVILVEATKIAHGATGHNAGQITSYFEKPFSELVQEFDLELAADAQRAVHSGWKLLEGIYEDCSLQTPYTSFTGYAGFSSRAQLDVVLRSLLLQARAGMTIEYLFIAEQNGLHIDAEFDGLYTIVPHEHICRLLETKDRRYIAALSTRKGCLNSARFSEELAGYLLSNYPERFRIYEHTPVRTAVLEADQAVLLTHEYTLVGKRVVLCTNGFEYIRLRNLSGGDIDTSFHNLVKGTVGYMSGYIEHSEREPTAISYLTTAAAHESEPYFYLTRRGYSENQRLVCIGGPEIDLPDRADYHPHVDYLPHAQQHIDSFLQHSYVNGEEPYYAFRWHGLMGYTATGVRVIGAEPANPVLLYNLGCNGVGILPSLYGGQRIAWLLQGKQLSKSVFDPRAR